MRFMAAPSFGSALLLLDALRNQPDVRVYRPAIWRHCKKAISLAAEGLMASEDATVSIREQNRYAGRPMSCRSVGSTLLLKRLEADIAVVLNPEQMDANHLYVALTRGARQVVVCSSTPILRPKANECSMSNSKICCPGERQTSLIISSQFNRMLPGTKGRAVMIWSKTLALVLSATQDLCWQR